MRNLRIWFGMVFLGLVAVLPVAAQVSISALGTPVTQDFNTLAISGTNNELTLPGWYLTESGGGARDNEQYAADNGSSNTGDTYSYGATGDAERALGGLQSSSLIPVFGAAFTNATGSTITELVIAYTGEQWRLGTAGRTDRIDFQYSLDATSLTTGTWTNVDTLDFVTPNTGGTAGARNGNDPAYRTALSATIGSLSIPNGATFWIRWTDFNASGADDGLAVDDFSLTAAGTPAEPALSINDVSLLEGNSGTTTFTFTVSLSAPAGSGGVTFSYYTTDGSATTADNDYVPTSGAGSIAAGETSTTIEVVVNGDTTPESNEDFFVFLSATGGATVLDGQGVGTILDDDSLTLSIDDVTVSEGDSGTTTATFTVTLSAPSTSVVTFDIATADGTATAANNDYVPQSTSGFGIFPPETQRTVTVTINGDTTFEADETFFVNIVGASGASVADGQGQCTILNDDPLPNIVINEILADPAASASGDANGDGVYNTTQDEFVELVNASGADLDISGWTLSDATGVRHVFPAGTVVPNNCSVVVFGGGTPTGVFGGSVVQVASSGQLGLNNGGDTVTLRLGAATVATYTYGAEGGDDQSLTRSPDISGPLPLVKHTTAPGSGGARFSAGKLLTGYPFSGCSITPFVGEIWEIQGSAAASPYAGGYVTTTANVVTAVGPDGFFIQTPDARADASADTSNGIFVYTATAPSVAVGDVVDVTGEVKEYYNFTEITFPTVTVVGTGAPLPTAIEFNASTPDPDPINPPAPACALEYECWEGMRIHVANGLVVGPNQSFGSDTFAEMFAVASPTRPFRSPGIKFPGLPGLPVWDGNPEVFELDPDRLGLPNAVMPAGTPFSASGVLAYEFGGWELWPTQLAFDAPPVLPRAVRPKSPLEMTVGSLNLLNYNSAAADYATRTAKHSGYIRTVLGAPDVLGVAEVENLATLQGLASQLHADDPTLNYTAYLGPIDKSGIDVGFLVRDTVTNVVITQLGADEVFWLDGSLLHDRPPLLLEADYVGNGAPFHFAVMVNHTRSFLNIDAPDPLGNWVRQKRLAQAQSIATKVQDFQTANPTTPLVLVGDYNAYEFTDGYVDVIGQIAGDAVAADNLVWAPPITNPIMTKQALNVSADDRYSYVHDGTSQVIDHALTTQATDPWVRGMAFGRGNSDAAEQFVNDGSTILRSSDHDGLVLYLVTDGNANGVPDDLDEADLSIAKSDAPDPVLAGTTLTYTLSVANAGPNPAYDVVVIDTLPAGVTFVSASGTDWTCNHTAGVVTCTRPTLAVGAAPDITITVTAPFEGGTLSNVATVSCPLTDPQTTNNSDAEETSVTAVTDLALVMMSDKSVALLNETFTHTALVTNNGPSAATGVTLTISLPAGATVSAITPATCSLAGSTVTCTTNLASGSNFTAHVTMSAATSGIYTSSGVVTGAELDPNSDNNTYSATTHVGQVVVAPNPVNMRVPIYSSGQSTLTITNTSPIDTNYQLLGRVLMPTWELWPYNVATWEMPAEHRNDWTARAVPEHSLPALTSRPLSPAAVLDFPSGLAYPWGIGVNYLSNDLWVSNIAIAGGDDHNYRFLLDGTPTGDTIDTSAWVGSFAADMTYDPFANTLWQVNVGGDDCIHEFNPSSKTWTGQTICPDWGGVSERGLAYDGMSDTFFAGSWTDGAIKRFNRAGDVLETANVGLDIAGLAYNPSTEHLFVLANTDAATDLYVLDTANGYAVVDAYKVAGMGAYEQGGLDADCAGNLYAVNQITKQVLVLPSGETGFCNLFDIPWMTPTPASGSLPAGTTQNVTLDFITAQQWPGLHRGIMTVAGTTPFPAQTVPVNYTIAFLDVPADHWADRFIHGLAGARVTRGCGGGNFCPDAQVSRAEMAILMVRAMHGPLFRPPAAAGIFVDVPISDTDHTADYIEQLYRDGVVAGCAQDADGDLYYCPNDLVNRAQMAVFLCGGRNIPGVNPPIGYFDDVHGTEFEWAEPFIEAIFNAGITAGCDVHKFCPAQIITRAQLAVWLVSAFNIPYLAN